MSSRNANYATEAQNFISMINNMSGKYNEVKQVLETYHNNFTRIATDFESISRIITSLQSEMGHTLSANNIPTPTKEIAIFGNVQVSPPTTANTTPIMTGTMINIAFRNL
ncbi:unnamed protein product [Rhizophagus irregularis]|uniref:Uncharacterized protein n=1 Tax=Rhizophagus irregularis TaxID=588596 RepID=A0A916EEH2_9GLOM|nr:unnamed protein product [Rhizophagus irregularis]CAB5384750.1 unnamed protein product [Rhizophagus irregularis]